jgi:hypothetical protein
MSIPPTVTPSLNPFLNDPRVIQLQRDLEERKLDAQMAINRANASLLAVKQVLDDMIELRDLIIKEQEHVNHAQV